MSAQNPAEPLGGSSDGLERRGRKRLPPPEGILELLGKKPDRRLADQFSMPVTSVRRLREAHGIAPASFTPGKPPRVLDKEILDQLGKRTDARVSIRIKVDRRTVARWRKANGIPSYKRNGRSKLKDPM